MKALATTTPWTDDEMLQALQLRDYHGLSAAAIAERMGRSRSSVLGMFKRIADDEAAAEMPIEVQK